MFKEIPILSQESYISKVLKWFNISTCKPIDTKCEYIKSCSLASYGKNKMTTIIYANAVSSLMYVIKCTWQDIAYVVGLNKYQSNPNLMQWKVVQRILRYLNDTTHYFLLHRGTNLKLIGYTNADWAIMVYSIANQPLDIFY